MNTHFNSFSQPFFNKNNNMRQMLSDIQIPYTQLSKSPIFNQNNNFFKSITSNSAFIHNNIQKTLSDIRIPYTQLSKSPVFKQNNKIYNLNKSITQINNYNNRIFNIISKENMIIGIKTNNLINSIKRIPNDKIISKLSNNIYSPTKDINNSTKSKYNNKNNVIDYSESTQINNYLKLYNNSDILKEYYYKIKMHYTNIPKPVKCAISFIIMNILNTILSKISGALINYGISFTITIINYLIN